MHTYTGNVLLVKLTRIIYEGNNYSGFQSSFISQNICPYGLGLYGLFAPMEHPYKFSTMHVAGLVRTIYNLLLRN